MNWTVFLRLMEWGADYSIEDLRREIRDLESLGL
jgi:hypothetical protein